MAGPVFISMTFLNFLRIFCVSFAISMCISSWPFYRLYYPNLCPSDSNRCLKSYLAKTPHPPLKLWVFSSTTRSPDGSDLYPVWELNDFKPNENFTKDVTVRIPFGMHNNGTMFVHVFLAPAEGGRGEENPFDADWVVNQTGILTYYTHHQELVAADQRICHWQSRLTLNVMTDNITFDRKAIPNQLTNYIWPHEDQYLPILLIDEMSYRTKDLLPLNITCKEMPLTISYTPVQYIRFRVWLDMKDSISQENNGMSEGRKEYIKEIFITKLPSLILTWALQTFYILFVLLAYERDISFWQERKTMAGLSTQTVVWRSVSFLVIFLHMLDDEECLGGLIAIGIISVIEIWKVLKVFQVRVFLTEWRLVSDNVGVSNKELETQALDAQAMRYLSCVLYPSWVAVIIYTVMYNFQKSWYSLCIQSISNGFYCYGSLFMLPQVFINYKLKSVADLPWMVLMFRAFMGFIRDICRFILIIPIDNFGAYFLDEVIFVIYVYQRWLYWA